ncbi:hypothetical protein V8F20_001553 [Naviculisporaceae sp. PSN 640]
MMKDNSQVPSFLGLQNIDSGSSQHLTGSSKSRMDSGSGNPGPKSVPNIGTSATAGGSKAFNGHEDAQGSGGRGRWVNRMLVRLGLRTPDQSKDVTSDAESLKSTSRRRPSSWLKRGLLRKDKTHKGKANETSESHQLMHNRVDSFEEIVDQRDSDNQAAKSRLSVVPEHPRLSTSVSTKTKATISQQTGPDPECELDPPVDTDCSESPRKGDEQQVLGVEAQPSTNQSVPDAEPRLSTQSREEQHDKQLESTRQSIADLYAASFQLTQPSSPVSPSSPNDFLQSDSKGDMEFSLDAANISVLGMGGASDKKFGKQPQRLVTAGWLASLPSTSDISQLRRNSFAAEVIKGTPPEMDQLRQTLHQEGSFATRRSGGFVRGSCSIPHLASSRHPIADAHAEEWRRRTVGGFPIPERYSSRWGRPRSRSRCASSRRCGSVESRQTTYNPFDLPRIPRQPLFTDLVDLLSLSKVVGSSLNNEHGFNNDWAHQHRLATPVVSRLPSFSSSMDTCNKGGRSGSCDWSSLAGGHGENTNSTLFERSGSGSGCGSRLVEQPSSLADGSTITNSTVMTLPPLFQSYLLPFELQGSGLGINLSEGFMASHVVESNSQAQQGADDKGTMKTMTLPRSPSHKSEDIGPDSAKPSSEIFPAAGISPSSETSGGADRGSGDTSVPEAWWTNQGQPLEHVSHRYRFEGGRPETPSSPMSRRLEKLNIRKRRERESYR